MMLVRGESQFNLYQRLRIFSLRTRTVETLCSSTVIMSEIFMHLNLLFTGIMTDLPDTIMYEEYMSISIFVSELFGEFVRSLINHITYLSVAALNINRRQVAAGSHHPLELPLPALDDKRVAIRVLQFRRDSPSYTSDSACSAR